MSLKSKRGITVTSIMVYVLLFFAFTTIATVISSRFNKNLFNDRGNAINVTAINKLEYNLIDSASNSYNVDVVANGNNRTLTFSNSDVYVFDNDNNVIYKNGGKLVKFVKESKVKIQEDVIAIDLTLNKYTNEVSRSIKVKCSSKINSTSYLSEGLVAQYDGIKNTNLGHDNSSLVWQDISGSNVQAEFNDYVKNNGVENYWKDDGIYFTKQKDTSDYQRVGGTTTYAGNIYSAMTFEITMTNLSDLGTGGTDYMYPLYIRQTDGSAILFFGIRKNVSLMYRSGHNTVFNNTKINVLKNHKYTFTFVQENLTTRALYINGALIQRTTGLALDSIIFGQILMQSHQNGSYIINSLRVYDRALSANEVLQNYNVDVLRFGN
mgnify:CR=1 FL=1